MSAPITDPEIRVRFERLRADVLRTARSWGGEVAKDERWNGFWARVLPVALAVAKLGFLIAAPLVTLVAGSVLLYRVAGVPTWLALATGCGVTAAVVGWYAYRLTRVVTQRVRFRFVVTRVALPLVGAYCVYAMLYLSHVNAKSEEVRGYYTSMHPMLRLAVSTAIVFDRNLVVTDMARVPEDYDRMGLPRYENSLHFAQRDGYVHAVDVRTLHRAEWRNLIARAYFGMMGFRTLRHVGTADHLHVSLPLPERR